MNSQKWSNRSYASSKFRSLKSCSTCIRENNKMLTWLRASFRWHALAMEKNKKRPTRKLPDQIKAIYCMKNKNRERQETMSKLFNAIKWLSVLSGGSWWLLRRRHPRYLQKSSKFLLELFWGFFWQLRHILLTIENKNYALHVAYIYYLIWKARTMTVTPCSPIYEKGSLPP